MKSLNNEEGMLLAITITIISACMILLAMLAPYGVGMARIGKAMGPDRLKALGNAEFGVILCRHLIWYNLTDDLGGGSFLDPNYDPPARYVDLETLTFSETETADSDILIDIGPIADNNREINSTGLVVRG